MPASPNIASFRALFDEHLGFVWRVLARHGVPTRDLPDGCQEVFLVLHQKLAEFEGRSTLRSFLYGIAVRVALGMRRKVHRKRELLEEAPHEPVQQALQMEHAAQRQSLSLVERAVATLSEEQRETFVLYELEGMIMVEVARATGVPEGTALHRLYAAREAIVRFARRHESTGTRQLSRGPLGKVTP